MHVPPSPAGVNGTVPTAPLVPVRPVAPLGGPAEELARAGVDLHTLLQAGADELVARTLPGTTALADLLERARAALVRGAPGEALAALDEGWEGAARTEGGWYYRAGALALLGLPGEAERVLHQALVLRGGSVALHFLQSVVRSGLGDSAGAREALAAALARQPADHVLLGWQAVLTARLGDRPGALRQVASLADTEPQQSVLTWVRQAVATAGADTARATLAARGWAGEETGVVDRAVEADEPLRASGERFPTPLDDALRRLGARLASTSTHEVRRDVRALLQALAPGGTLDRTSRPEQVPAVRSVLAAVLGVLATSAATSAVTGAGRAIDSAGTAVHEATDTGIANGSPAQGKPVPGQPVHGAPAPGATRREGRAQYATPSASTPLEAQVGTDGRWRLTPGAPVPAAELVAGAVNRPRAAFFEALRVGHFTNAATWIPRVAGMDGDAVAAVLRTLLDGARQGVTDAAVAGADEPVPDTARAGTGSRAEPVVRPARADDPLLTPIRIGLSLLREASARVEARSAASPANATPAGGWAANGLAVRGGIARAGEGASLPGEAARGVSSGHWTEPVSGALAAQAPAVPGAVPSAFALQASAALGAAAAGVAGAAVTGAPAERDMTTVRRDFAQLAETYRNGRRLRALALGCMALAFAAMVYGQGILAIALAGGASWLALRSSAVAAAARRAHAGHEGAVTPDDPSR